MAPGAEGTGAFGLFFNAQNVRHGFPFAILNITKKQTGGSGDTGRAHESMDWNELPREVKENGGGAFPRGRSLIRMLTLLLSSLVLLCLVSMGREGSGKP